MEKRGGVEIEGPNSLVVRNFSTSSLECGVTFMSGRTCKVESKKLLKAYCLVLPKGLDSARQNWSHASLLELLIAFLYKALSFLKFNRSWGVAHGSFDLLYKALSLFLCILKC